MDLSKMTREQLIERARLIEKAREIEAKNQAEKLGQNDPTLIDKAAGLGLGALSAVGTALDYPGGAPTRAAISAGLKGENPITAGLSQYGKSPSEAPRGSDIAEQIGIPKNKSFSDYLPFYSDQPSERGLISKAVMPFSSMAFSRPQKGGLLDPTLAGAAGAAIDIGADPLTYTGVVPAAKALGRGARYAGELALDIPYGIGKGVLSGTAKGVDLLTGTKVGERTFEGLKAGKEKAVEAAQVGAAAAKGAIEGGLDFLSSDKGKINPEWSKYEGIAKKNGIDPALLSEDVKYGKGSRIARESRVLREGPEGEAEFARHEAGKQAISDAIDNRINSIAGVQAPNEVQAGQIIQQSLGKQAEDMFNAADITYKKVLKYAPGVQVNRTARETIDSLTGGMRRRAKAMERRPVGSEDAAYAAQLNLLADTLDKSKSMKQFVEVMQRVGKKAYGRQVPVLGAVPHDIKELRNIYGKMREAVIDTVRADINPEFADELIQNNKIMSDFFKKQQVLESAFDPNLAPEKVFSYLVQKGDTKTLENLMEILPETSKKQISAAYLRTQVPFDSFSDMAKFKTALNKLQKSEQTASRVVNPKDLKDVKDLLMLGEQHGIPVMSTSGTGASNQFAASIKERASLEAARKRLAQSKAKAEQPGLIKPDIEMMEYDPNFKRKQELLRRGLLQGAKAFSIEGK